MQEDYISFETAKLLKEKGFEEYCTSLYRANSNIEFVGNYNNVDDNKYISFSCPTQALVVKWLRVEHSLHVEVKVSAYQTYYWNIVVEPTKTHKGMGNMDYFDKTINQPLDENNTSPEQATEAAILYCLQNLIK